MYCLRLVALDVIDNPMGRVKDIRCYEADTDIFGASSSSVRSVLLSGCWYETDISGGDVFHVVLLSEISWQDDEYRGEWDEGAPIIVDDRNNLLVHHPDVLVSPSKVIDGLSCNRRGLLSSRISSMGRSSSAAVLGSTKHAFIEVSRASTPTTLRLHVTPS